jgi:glutathione S-transferase
VASTGLKLYHAIISVCAQKVRVMLAEKGLGYDEKVMSLRGDQFEPAYMQLNPNALVPTLVHDGKPVIESTVILHYLDDTFAQPPMMPRDAAGRERVHAFSRMLDEHIHAACSVLTFALAFRPAMMRLDPQAREALLSPQPDQSKAERKRDVTRHGMDSKYAVDALARYDRLLQQMEEALADGDWLAGAACSIADIGVVPYIVRLDMLRLSAMWDARPRVAAWYGRMKARPSVRREILDRFSQCDLAAFANFEPDPWPKARALLGTPAKERSLS